MIFFDTQWQRFKKKVVRSAMASEASAAGFIRRTITLSFGEIVYYEKPGKKRTLILLHGAGADKNSWCRFAKYLPKDDRIIVPDLPGHGESTCSLSLDYGIEHQTHYLNELSSRLNVGQAHLVGHSMGGALALRYAHHYPNAIQSLVLIDAAGVEQTPSELQQEMERTGTNPMLSLENTSDYKKMLHYGMSKPPYIPGFFLDILASDKIARCNIERKVYNDFCVDLDQTSILPSLTLPVLILWGKLDRILHVDNAELLHDLLPNSQKIVMDAVGHVPIVEAPRLTAQFCTAFWQNASARERTMLAAAR